MLNRFAATAACLALFACKGPTEEPTPTESGTPPPQCQSVSDAFPGDGALGVYYRTSLSWTFVEAETDVSVTVTDAGGTEVAGSGDWVGTVYVWEPTGELMPETVYTAALTYCGGEQTATTTFTTSAVGTPTDETTLTGKTYELDLTAPNVNFIEPPGVGALLQAQLAGVVVLVNVESATATEIDMIGALGDGATPPGQDLCTPSIPFPIADFSENPYFEIGPEDTTISVAGFDVSIDQLKISGAFDSTQSVIAGAVLEGSVDTRPLVELLQPGGGDDAVCTLVGNFGISCEDCGGGEMFCLSLKVNNINADQVVGVDLVERLQADIDADANCAPAAP